MSLYQYFINSLYALGITIVGTTIIALISETYDTVVVRKRNRKFLNNLKKEFAKELKGIDHDTSNE